MLADSVQRFEWPPWQANWSARAANHNHGTLIRAPEDPVLTLGRSPLDSTSDGIEAAAIADMATVSSPRMITTTELISASGGAPRSMVPSQAQREYWGGSR